MPEPKSVKPDERVPFPLTPRERDLILDRTLIGGFEFDDQPERVAEARAALGIAA